MVCVSMFIGACISMNAVGLGDQQEHSHEHAHPHCHGAVINVDKFKKNAETTVKDIKTKTGFDVTKAIEINKATAEEEVAPEKVRRAAPITAAESDAPVRRAAAPKYKITSIVE